MYTDTCKIRQQFKNIKTLYGRLPPKNIAELKPWDAVYVNLLVSYSKSASQQQPDGTIINNNFRLTWMAMIDPATGWVKIFEVPTYDLDKLTGGNGEYIYT